MKLWPLISKKTVFQNFFLHLRSEKHTKPTDPKVEHDFFIFEMGSWINVIALTPDKQVVLVKQWRAGTGKISLEIPGGAMDRGEDPQRAAERELKEETGYTSSRVEQIGVVEPNPALLTNRCYTYLAWDVEKTDEPHLDLTEEIEVSTIPFSEMEDKIKSGEIKHALVVAAYYFAQKRLQEMAP